MPRPLWAGNMCYDSHRPPQPAVLDEASRGPSVSAVVTQVRTAGNAALHTNLGWWVSIRVGA
jgi:hypothetical protein